MLDYAPGPSVAIIRKRLGAYCLLATALTDELTGCGAVTGNNSECHISLPSKGYVELEPFLPVTPDTKLLHLHCLQLAASP